jgi:hypothetical protein
VLDGSANERHDPAAGQRQPAQDPRGRRVAVGHRAEEQRRQNAAAAVVANA